MKNRFKSIKINLLKNTIRNERSKFNKYNNDKFNAKNISFDDLI
jgi:hypothetical protein